MDIEIIEDPVRFQLYGTSDDVEGRPYSDVGLRLMDVMWKHVEQAKLTTNGVSYWVYTLEDRMFVGTEVSDAAAMTIPDQLEPMDFELKRYMQHVHIGPYQQLPQKWQSLKALLAAQQETATLPSLEVYGHSGHSCEDEDESEPVTTILMGLRPQKPKTS